MIRYALCCRNSHEFEAWFASSAAYEKQARRRMVSCPACGSQDVEKQVMAPALLKGRATVSPSETRVTAASGPGTVPPLEVVRAWKKHVIANSEDVGGRFAEEARKIHNGEADERAIRGEASSDEARKLAEDGVPFGLLPVLPEDHN